jgi:hypothetical protein
MSTEGRLWVYQPQHGRAVMIEPGISAFDPDKHAVVIRRGDRHEADMTKRATSSKHRYW